MKSDKIKEFVEQTEGLVEKLSSQIEELIVIRDREQSKLDLFKTLLK